MTIWIIVIIYFILVSIGIVPLIRRINGERSATSENALKLKQRAADELASAENLKELSATQRIPKMYREQAIKEREELEDISNQPFTSYYLSRPRGPKSSADEEPTVKSDDVKR